MSIRIAAGQTPKGATNWIPYKDSTRAVYVDVDTSEAGFQTTPVYVSAVAGHSAHYAITGGSAIYDPTPQGFRVYVRYPDESPVTPEFANECEWHITWIGVEA